MTAELRLFTDSVGNLSKRRRSFIDEIVDACDDRMPTSDGANSESTVVIPKRLLVQLVTKMARRWLLCGDPGVTETSHDEACGDKNGVQRASKSKNKNKNRQEQERRRWMDLPKRDNRQGGMCRDMLRDMDRIPKHSQSRSRSFNRSHRYARVMAAISSLRATSSRSSISIHQPGRRLDESPDDLDDDINPERNQRDRNQSFRSRLICITS